MCSILGFRESLGFENTTYQIKYRKHDVHCFRTECPWLKGRSPSSTDIAGSDRISKSPQWNSNYVNYVECVEPTLQQGRTADNRISDTLSHPIIRRIACSCRVVRKIRNVALV